VCFTSFFNRKVSSLVLKLILFAKTVLISSLLSLLISTGFLKFPFRHSFQTGIKIQL
jgi:hypothetical protein